MSVAGYSGTALVKRTGMKILLFNPPENYMELLETDIRRNIFRGRKRQTLFIFLQKMMRRSVKA